MYRCAWQPLLPPESMGYFHQIIIHDNSKMVGWHAVGFEQNFIINEGGVKRNLPRIISVNVMVVFPAFLS